MEILDVEKFEDWSKSRGYLHNFDKEDCFPPVYKHPDTQYAWEVWVSAIDSTGAAEMLEVLASLDDFWGDEICEAPIHPGAYILGDEPIRDVIRRAVRKARGEQ